MGSIEEVVDVPVGHLEPGIALRDAQARALDEVAELLGEVYGVYREHFPAEDAWRSYIGEIVDVRSIAWGETWTAQAYRIDLERGCVT